MRLSLLAVVLLLPAVRSTAQASPNEAVGRMAENERAARAHVLHYSFVSQERSTRTGGHMWTEHVVEIDDGPVRRLLRIDNRPLTPAEADAESGRLQDLASHPETFKKLNASSQGDETHMTALLSNLSTAMILTPDGGTGSCSRFAFKPNPQFQPSSMEQRVVQVMEGTVSIKEPENRLCSLDATIAQPVSFGFGMLGKVEKGGSFQLVRREVAPREWKTTHMVVHMDGRVLMMKSLARDLDATRSEVTVVPQHLTLQQAVDLSRP